jgi:hypothetical protein
MAHASAGAPHAVVDRSRLDSEYAAGSKMEIDFLFLVINGTEGRWVGLQTRTGLVQLDETDQGATADDAKNI